MADNSGALIEQAGALVASVGQLQATVQELSTSNTELRESNVELVASNAKNTTRGRRNRTLILGSILGLLLDLGLSALFYVQHQEQVRINHRIDCQNALRAKASVLADSDRANTTGLITAIPVLKTEAQLRAAFATYKRVAEANNAARVKLGSVSADTCS